MSVQDLGASSGFANVFRRPLFKRSCVSSILLVGNGHQAGVAAGGCGVDAARDFFKHLQDVQALFGWKDADECAVAFCQLLLAAAVQRA